MTLTGKQCPHCHRRIEIAVAATNTNVMRAVRLAQCDDCRTARGEPELRGVKVRWRPIEPWFSLPPHRERDRE